jgi:hypothetical protein
MKLKKFKILLSMYFIFFFLNFLNFLNLKKENNLMNYEIS